MKKCVQKMRRDFDKSERDLPRDPSYFHAKSVLFRVTHTIERKTSYVFGFCNVT